MLKKQSFGTNQQRQQEKLFQERKAHLILYLIVFLGEEIREKTCKRSPSIVGFEKVEGDLKGELASWSMVSLKPAVLRGDLTDVKAPIIKKTIAGTGKTR